MPKKAKSEIQTFIFDRDHYTKQTAIKWLQRHGYKYNKYDLTRRSRRFRQHPPTKYKRMRTKAFGDNIKVVLGYR